jgi:hypothetical protein
VLVVCINNLAIFVYFQVILIQEQLSKNRIIIDTDSKGRSYSLQAYLFINFVKYFDLCIVFQQMCI